MKRCWKKKGTSVDVLPWPKCVEFKTPYPDNHRSKLLLEAAIRQLHRPFVEYPPPISMVRAGKRIEMRATERLAKGKCVIPIFFRKPDSMVMEDDQCGARPRNGVCCTVYFTRHLESIAETVRSGEFAAEASVNVFIAPEVKVPKGKVNTALAWANGELHPFWLVKRGVGPEKTNMKLVYLSTSNSLACDTRALSVMGASVKSVGEIALIQYPCLVNSVDVEKDEELILAWSQEAVLAPKKKKKDDYDQLSAAASKAKKSRQ